MKGGRAPLSHFPPGHAGVKPCGFAAVSFFLVRCTAVSSRDPSSRSDEPRRGPSSASRRLSEVRREPHGDPGAGVVEVGEPDSQPSVARASEVRREPHGDPGAGVVGVGEPDSQPSVARASEVRREPHGDPGAGGAGVGEPDSQPLLARESQLPCAPPAGRGKFRLVVTDCERGACPPFTLSPRTCGRQTLRVRRHEFFLVWCTAVSRRDPSSRSDEPRRGPSSASRRLSEVRREPHGDPGAGVVGVGEPDSEPSVARASEVRREPHGDPGAGGAGVGDPTPSRP